MKGVKKPTEEKWILPLRGRQQMLEEWMEQLPPLKTPFAETWMPQTSLGLEPGESLSWNGKHSPWASSLMGSPSNGLLFAHILMYM